MRYGKLQKLIAAVLLFALSFQVQADLPEGLVTAYYTHTDLQGSVVVVTDQNRTVVETYHYEPYGLPTAPTASSVMTPDGTGYTGHVHDPDSGLVYMQQRYYDPLIGQFVSVDPVLTSNIDGSNFNRYWYANNNPYKYVDPDGEFAFLIVFAPELIALADAALVVTAGLLAADAINHAMNNENGEDVVKPDANEPEPGTRESSEGCIYCVNGENTESGKEYIGSTDDLKSRSRDKSDGRDREGAEKIDSYPKGDRETRRVREQQAINDRGGVDNLDNKRNEVSPEKWEDKGITPPTN